MPSVKLPRIYPITDGRLSGLSHGEQVRRLIAGGATFIQLRDKEATPAEFFDYASEALDIAGRSNVKLIINDRVDVALALKADGVHLGQDDMPPEKARQILGPNAIIGFSTHDIDQVRAATEMPIDYVAFGPIFATSTKQAPDPTVGIEALARIREIVREIPLVAIGGIAENNVRQVIATGADSAAVVSAVVAHADHIESNMRKLRVISGL